MKTEMSDKAKELKEIMTGLNKKIQKGTTDTNPFCFVASDRPDLLETSYVKTGIPELDDSLGGGLPKKTVVTFHGMSGAGKSCAALSTAARMTKEKKYVLYINTEPPFNWDIAKQMEIDLDYLVYIEPKDYGEQSIDAIEGYLFDSDKRIARDLFDLVVVDSINNIVPKAIIDKLEKEGAEGNNMARRAKLIDEFLQRIQGRGLLRNGGLMILIAQDRANLTSTGHGPATVMSGGQSIKFNSKVIVKFNKTGIKDTKTQKTIGHIVKFEVEKNNIKGILGKGEYSVIYGVGLDDAEAIYAKALDWEYIVKAPELGRKGYRILLPDGDRIITDGIAAVKDMIKTDLEAKNQLRTLIDLGKPKIKPTSVGFEKVTLSSEESEIEE
jgi:RecA/RadA recombinase